MVTHPFCACHVFTRTGVVMMRISAVLLMCTGVVMMRISVVLVRTGIVLMRISAVIMRTSVVLMHRFVVFLKLLLVGPGVICGRRSRISNAWTLPLLDLIGAERGIFLRDLVGAGRNRRLGPDRPSTQEQQAHHHQHRAQSSFHHLGSPLLLLSLDSIKGAADPVVSLPRWS
jgi:hypothetical protein